MPQCNRCQQEIGWKNFGTAENPKWVPWDERRDVAHECPNRDGTPKKKAEVEPPRDDRLVLPPANEEAKITLMRIEYGETRQLRPYESRRYNIMLEYHLGQGDQFQEADNIRLALKRKVEDWFLGDLQEDLEGKE